VRSSPADRPEPSFAPGPAFPRTVIIAGIVSIIFGSIIVVSVLVKLWRLAESVAWAARRRHFDILDLALGEAVIQFIIGLVGAAFIVRGNQCARGTARDTLANGIASIIFGLLMFGAGALMAGSDYFRGSSPVIRAGVLFLTASAVLATGVLFLAGHRNYIVGWGIAIIVFGLLVFGAGALELGSDYSRASSQAMQASVFFPAAACLLAAGALFLVGRSKYKAWRKAQKARREVGGAAESRHDCA
jgi:hypothetical protein